jgi:hypothetical protein
MSSAVLDSIEVYDSEETKIYQHVQVQQQICSTPMLLLKSILIPINGLYDNLFIMVSMYPDPLGLSVSSIDLHRHDQIVYDAKPSTWLSHFNVHPCLVFSFICS